ncbi:hypothetical protein V501_10165, partial [Pseudogymnoascus sp. VKM F-4519 (FW-2642)]
YRTGRVDPDFDAARIGPDLGPQLEAELQAGREAGREQIESNYREALDRAFNGREEPVQYPFGGQELIQQPYDGQWQAQPPYVGESLAQQSYIGQSVAPPAAYESVQDRQGYLLTDPAATTAAAVSGAVSASNPLPQAPHQEPVRLRDLPFHPDNLRKREKKAALEALTTEPKPSSLSATAPPFQSLRKVPPEVAVSLQDLDAEQDGIYQDLDAEQDGIYQDFAAEQDGIYQDLAAEQDGIYDMTPPSRNVVPQVGAPLQDLPAGQVGGFNMAPIPTPQVVDPNVVAQLQDLVYQPGGIPDILPEGLTQMPGLDPRFLPGPDGQPPVLPPPPSEPLPDLATQFRNAFAQFEVGNAAAAAGPVEPVVPAAPKKLVVVCCLATWVGTKDTEDKWVGMPAQGTRKGWGMDVANPQERECWKKHIWKGLEVLKEMDGEGVLMFSGGPWYDNSRISAAKSYQDFARASNYWGYLRGDKYKDYPSRIITEDRAMDSLQNVMFSLIEFNIRYKNFPEEMRVISYELKRERFENIHFKTAKEILFPTPQEDIDVSWQGIPTFIGIDPRDLSDNFGPEKGIAIGELETQVRDLWRESPYGLSRELMSRKEERNRLVIDLHYQLVFAGGGGAGCGAGEEC